MRAKEVSACLFRTGDQVSWTPATADETLPTTGLIVAVRPPSGGTGGFDECVVQVTPTILAIHPASLLVRVQYAEPEEELFEMLVP
jgi:hypothetical protein